MKLNILFLAVCLVTRSAHAQSETPAQATDVKTQLESFAATPGMIIIRGFSQIGTLTGRTGTSASIEARELRDAVSGRREYGIAITLTETAKLEREDVAYVDYDEIDSLLSGIDYVSKVDSKVTPFDRFEAEFKIKGDFSVSTFTETNKVQAALQTRRVNSVSVFLTLEQLSTFKSLIQQAKAKLDSVRK